MGTMTVSTGTQAVETETVVSVIASVGTLAHSEQLTANSEVPAALGEAAREDAAAASCWRLCVCVSV
jgi:hypothetical protein